MRKKAEEKLDRILLELTKISAKLDKEDAEEDKVQKKFLEGMANILSYGEKHGL